MNTHHSLLATGTSGTRRQFLRSGSQLALAAGLATSPQLLQGADMDESLIDAHVHVWTPDLAAYPLAKGYTREKMNPPSFTPEQLFAHCQPHGVQRIVLIQMSYYGFDNRYMLDMMKKHAGRFSGVAVIDENNEPARHMQELAQQGVRGFRIRQQQRPGDGWLNTPGMARMWKAGAEHGLAMCHLCQPDSFPAIEKMCRKYPQTPVVIDHFGRLGISGEIPEKDLENLCRLGKQKNAHVKVSAFYALGKKKAPYTDLVPMIRRLLDAFGPERLMWASDGPFQVVGGHHYGPSIDLVKKADFLSDGDKAWLLRKTAEKVFFS